MSANNRSTAKTFQQKDNNSNMIPLKMKHDSSSKQNAHFILIKTIFQDTLLLSTHS